MTARSPHQLHQHFAAAFNARDVAALIALFDPDATMVPAPGAASVRGHPAIAAALGGLLALQPTDAALETLYVIERDDLALARCRWHFTATMANGTSAAMAGSGVEVMRRQADGSWVFLLDNPWGGEG
jgi:uncharacterized protein (TIGR02246 family)